MPFKSKAQRRFMYATDPERAKKWEDETKDKDIPEKLHPETSVPKSEYATPKKKPMKKQADTDGMFFEKRAKPRAGRFFRDMAGRDDANFHQKTAMGSFGNYGGGAVNVSTPMYGGGTGKIGAKNQMSITGTGGAMGGSSGYRGEGIGDQGQGGGQYGTGRGQKKMARVQASNPENESGLPTGFHRPAYAQPEALEAGGERFHSTQAEPAQYGVGTGMQTSLPQGRMRMNPTHSGQMGKNAGYWSELANTAKGSFTEGGGALVDEGKKGLKRAAGNPWLTLGLAAAGTYGAGKLLRPHLRKAYRGARKLVGRPVPEAAAPAKGVVGRVGDKLKSMFKGEG